MAALEYEMDSRWEFCILHCTLSPSLSDSGLFHQRWARVKDPAGCSEVFIWTPHWHSSGKCRGESVFSGKLHRVWRSTGALGARSTKARFHSAKAIMALVCLFKSKYLVVSPLPQFPMFPVTAIFPKSDTVINTSEHLICKQWQKVCPCWNYNHESLEKCLSSQHLLLNIFDYFYP